MKKFALFLSALLLLIISEYYLLTEIFTRKRMPVMVVTLLCVMFSVLVFLRFFRQRFVA